MKGYPGEPFPERLFNEGFTKKGVFPLKCIIFSKRRLSAFLKGKHGKGMITNNCDGCHVKRSKSYGCFLLSIKIT